MNWIANRVLSTGVWQRWWWCRWRPRRRRHTENDVCSLVIWSREERNNFVKSNFHVYLKRTMKKWMKIKYNGEKFVYFLVNINKYNEIMIECRVYTFRTDWKRRIEWVWMKWEWMNHVAWNGIEWNEWDEVNWTG